MMVAPGSDECAVTADGTFDRTKHTRTTAGSTRRLLTPGGRRFGEAFLDPFREECAVVWLEAELPVKMAGCIVAVDDFKMERADTEIAGRIFEECHDLRAPAASAIFLT